MNASLDYDSKYGPDFAMLSVRLKEGETLQAEPSAMASMDTTIELKSGLKGGLLQSVGRALGGESLIVNTYRARRGAGEVNLAPSTLGDIFHYRMQGTDLLLQRGGYVASGEGVKVTGSWAGMKGFFSGEGLILLKASGEGDLFFGTYGAIVPVDVRDAYFVDTGYVVAFESTLQYSITTLPGLGVGGQVKSFFFGGEGLVCRFSGQGKLWIQTRAVNPFLTWVHPFRPQKSRN